MLSLDAISTAALPLLEVVKTTLPLRDDHPRIVALLSGGWPIVDLFSDWNDRAIDALPDQVGWTSPEHVQLAIWRRMSAADPQVLVGARIGTALFSYILTPAGETVEAYDARHPVPHGVALSLEIHGLDRPLLGRQPRILRVL